MRYSKRQIEVWNAREKLDRKLAGMSPAEITAYADDIIRRFRARTSGRARLKEVDLSHAEPSRADS